MSTEYYIVATDKEGKDYFFTSLYKMKNVLLSSAPNWEIESIIESYDEDTDSMIDRHSAHLLLRLIRFICDHNGCTFTFMNDNKLIDYMNDKYYQFGKNWSWGDIDNGFVTER
jgi:hypothetical protein